VAESIRGGLWPVVRELRGGFVLRPGAITVALGAIAIILTKVEERITPIGAWSDFLDRLFPPEPEAAHVVLGTIAGSMITVVAVVYSILLVVLTFASTQFSPRVLVAFVEDRVSQTTLGLFVGTFTYCLLTLPAVRSQPEPFVPSVAVIVAIGLAIACLACLLYFIHHMASMIQASHVVDEFGVLQIVDIALKAISPAVNDPTTALTCIDHLGRILVRAALRHPPLSAIRDRDGRARVVLPRTSFPRLLDVAFSQIGHYGKADVAVPLRLMRVLSELAGATRHAPYGVAIRDQARRLSAACGPGFPDADRDELNERLAAVEQAVVGITGSDGPPSGP
jgi:uncharacterized membrane protein